MIVTLDDVKTFLNISDTSQDTYLEQLRSGAEKFVKRYCGREFEAGTYTKQIFFESGIGWLPDTPVTAVSSVTTRDNITLNVYVWDSNGYIRLVEEYDGFANVTYTGGETPEDIKLALLRYIEYLCNKPEGVRQQSFEGNSVGFDVPQEVLNILDSYREKRL
jgi:hypothetical protein